MTRVFATCALAGVIALPSLVSAQPAGSSREALVVDPAWLAQHLHDPDLVLLQVGTQETYDKGHIPGARFADFMALHTMGSQPGALTLEVPPAEQLRASLEGLGISTASHVVVYASDDYWSPSTRVVLTLDYAGLSKVSYLDGGLKAWAASGQPLSKEPPLAKRGTLGAVTPHPVIVDAAFVQAHEHAAGFALVDARNTEFYDGSKGGGQRGQTKKFGHIPGAVSAPYDQFASGDGHLKPPSEIAAIFDRAGVKPGDTVIGYCHIGQQATAMLFAARTLGHKVLLYDGSFEDWNARGLPLEVPARKDR